MAKNQLPAAMSDWLAKRIPYGYNGYTPIFDQPIKRDGPARDYGKEMPRGVLDPGTTADGAAAAFTLAAPPSVSEATIRARPWESLWWIFGGKQVRVTKAMRIPYEVETKDAQGNDVKTTRYILIGFEGVDPPG
ncbi:MAG TPA: hypothetical protein VGQ62_21425 [Chloroflexota bacterium]|jgi:hypothetical protein|nr:hypothetical protein [Chloroflexota bacterium]